jgi:hypothetical protein
VGHLMFYQTITNEEKTDVNTMVHYIEIVQ